MTEERGIGVAILMSGETRCHQTGSRAMSTVPGAGCQWLAWMSLERARLLGLGRARCQLSPAGPLSALTPPTPTVHVVQAKRRLTSRAWA